MAGIARIVPAMLVLVAGLGLSRLEAGFRSPESLVRNVYAYYGDRSSDLSSGLPRGPGHVEFHCRQWDRRLGHCRCREPA
jgi:hypothetical protein